MTPTAVERALEQLTELVVIQKNQGMHDNYHRGMANGLICALSILTGKDPEYVKSPYPIDVSQKETNCDVSDEEIQHACDMWIQTRGHQLTGASYAQVVWGEACRWMRSRLGKTNEDV